MQNLKKLTTVMIACALALASPAVQDEIVLKRVAKAGDVTKYRMKADLDYKNSTLSFTGLITEKITKVADDGQYTVESKTSEGKVTFAGAQMESGSHGEGDTVTTFRSNGQIVTIISDQDDPNLYRRANLQSLQLPPAPLKVGGTWEVQIKKDDRGVNEAKGTFKLEGREKLLDTYDTYRIHGMIKESIDKDPVSVDATYWVNVADGALIQLKGKWTNAPYPSLGPQTTRVVMVREG